ncbi:hypothetical protein HMPREF3150_03137 [Pseudomonas aeruginosa]|nr:hypothetical protein HMPREF3150_03137 [Pseudomonas aeruginosa]
MQGKYSAAAGILKVLAFTAVIDADALDALLLNEVIDTQLAQFFQSCPSGSPKEWQPVTPRVLSGFSSQCIVVQQGI